MARSSAQHPEIAQHDVQALIWAILSRAKYEDLQHNLKGAASALLTSKQIKSLRRNALDMIKDDKIAGTFLRQAPLIRQVLEAEARLRNLLTSSGTTFADLERVAVLTPLGIEVPLGAGSKNVRRGRWSLHPDGYYVRYLPSGYSNTRLEIWVPEGSKAVGKEFDPADHVAVPGNTARQRLLLSGRLYGED